MANKWVLGARLRTLPAAVVPVVVGTALAVHEDAFVWWRALLALIVALALQVGVNYANDYSDGIKGTDADRVGPMRLVGSGLAKPIDVKRAAFTSFAIAAVAGLVLAVVVNPLLVVVGACAIVAAWFYTGGNRPYGYNGFGELSVFVFFGLVATIGTAYVQTEHIALAYFAAACAVGFIAVALLVVNNLRDLSRDKEVGKTTLSVRIGDKSTRYLYATLVSLPFVVVIMFLPSRPWVLLAFVAVPLRMLLVKKVLGGESGRNLISVLQKTGQFQLLFGVLFAIGLGL